jgi:hypothetical protein
MTMIGTLQVQLGLVPPKTIDATPAEGTGTLRL